MITVIVDKNKEKVTYSTLLIINNKPISIKVTKLLYYAKSYHLNHNLTLPADLVEREVTLFEELFYWPLELYTNSKRNHILYNLIKNSNYNYKSEQDYEVQWEVLEVYLHSENKNCLVIKEIDSSAPSSVMLKCKRRVQLRKERISKKSFKRINIHDKHRKISCLNIKKNWMILAIPPNSLGIKRYDYVTGDGHLHYNCKKDEYHGIEIFHDGNKKLLNC